MTAQNRLPASLRVAALLSLAAASFACGRPIELVDEGVVVVSGELPFSVADLSASARDSLRVSAELVGHGAAISLVLDEDGQVHGELAYVLESEGAADLVVRATGALSLADEPVLLAEHRRTLSLVPRGDAAVTLAKTDFTTKGASGVDAFRFDKNRNGRANIEDLLAGCAPGVPAPALVLSATDLQFTSGVAPGSFQRQVLVLDNFGDRDVEYWVRVVGAPGVLVSPLEVDAIEAPVPQPDIADEEAPLSLSPGEEALLAVTFAPADSTLTTGFLVVESRDACAVRQAGAVRLIGNADGTFAPRPADFDPGALPDPGALGLDDELPVSTSANLHLFDGEPVTLPALASSAPAVEVGDALARAAALVTLPAATRLGVGLVDLSADADLYVFPIDGTTLGEPLASIHPGTDAETLVLEPRPDERHLLVVVSEAPVDGAPRPIESYKLFFRASSVPTFADPALTPRVGSVEGGTSVTVFGAGFRPGAEVFFAGARASGVVVEPSGTQLTAVTPPGTLLSAFNPATLVVKNPPQGGAEPQYATLPEAFLYAPSPPVIIALDPASAVVGDDQLVLLRGAGFTEFFGPVEVTFGGVTSPSVSLLSSTELLALAPASSTPGAVEVSVRLRGPDPGELISTSAPAAFTWVEPLASPPTVTGVSPTSGPAGASLLLTVEGEGFAAGARVYFESGDDVLTAGAVTFVDETQLTAVTPALPAGDWAVVVENPDEQRALSRPTFRALEEAGADPLASVVTPDVVHAEVPGDTLSVLGANLTAMAPLGVAIESEEQSFAASLTAIVDAVATVRVDAPLPPGVGYRVRIDYGSVVVRSPPFAAEAPSLFAAQVIGAPAIEGQPFTLLLTGQRLFPARLTGVRFDGPTSATLAPASRTESNVRVDVPSLVQGSYAATLVYDGGFETGLTNALYVDGDCGDGVKSALEACDLTDLGGATCASVGFVGGALSCNADCTLNTSLCDGCGNGVLEAGEECDGADFGSASCEALGFTGGTLSCHAPSCSVVVSGCSLCGDGVAEDAEACDGSDLRGQTCSALGFTSGTLACRADCGALDVLGCQTCGDGVCSGSETAASCAADCVATCGNDTCDVGEDCATCPLDCATCAPYHVVVVAGAGQSAYIGQTVPSVLVLRVEDADGAPVPGAVLSFAPPPGGKVVASGGATAVSDAAGEVQVTVTLGFAVGAQSVVVTGIGPGGVALEELPLALPFTAEDVPTGTIYTLVNRFGTAGSTLDVDGVAPLSRLSGARGLALEPDGSLLVADRGNNRVMRVSPDGAITHVAGDGGANNDGELVDARTAGLHQPDAVLSDDAGGFYVGTANGSAGGRIRHVDADGLIRTYAGRATDTFPARGDGRPALDAYFADPWALAKHPSGDLIVVDGSGNQMVRRIASGTTTTSTLISSPAFCERDGDSTGLSQVSDVAFEGTTMYFATDAFPTNPGGVNACAPTQAQIGSLREGGTPHGVAATGESQGLTIDGAGNLYTWSESRREIVRIDRFGRVTAVAGNGSQGNAGEYVDARTASFQRPWSLVMSPAGDLYVSDDTNHNVRVIRGVGAQTEPAIALSLVSTPPFSAALMRASAPIVVRASLDGGPTAGIPIGFELLHGHAVSPPSAVSDLFGEASAVTWAGLVEDQYRLRVAVLDRVRAPIASTVIDLVVDGVAHPAGTVVPVVNPSSAVGTTVTGSALDTRMNTPFEVLALPDGSLVVADRINHRVLKAHPDGTTEVIAGTGSSTTFALSGAPAVEQPFPSPRGLARNDAGELFVAVSAGSPVAGRVYKIDLNGQAVAVAGGGVLAADGVVATSAALTTVFGLAYDDETDTLFLTDSNAIRRVTSDGYIYRVPFNTTCAPASVAGMNQVEVLGGNHIAVSADLNGCGGFSQFRLVLDVDVATGDLVELTDGLDLERTSSSADGFAVSPLSGLFYVESRYQIFRRESDGTFTLITGVDDTLGASAAPEPAPGALLNDPTSLSFDALGNLYFTETNRHGVRMIANPDAL